MFANLSLLFDYWLLPYVGYTPGVLFQTTPYGYIIGYVNIGYYYSYRYGYEHINLVNKIRGWGWGWWVNSCLAKVKQIIRFGGSRLSLGGDDSSENKGLGYLLQPGGF